MKENKFKVLAKSRTNKALKSIRLIGNLANKSHYSYSSSEADQVLGALEKELRVVKQKFRNSKSGRIRDEFDFKWVN